ncbi:unnamed protein product [Mytilus coruscus]|uniref:Retrotransposon gag domain-containing protein n=1 Tax=Mytilus coruscus TaxID=42192 RepID=A0A6J8CT46_MYTCO|nr:unnamed protein product [Mytilus coruscus]
MQPISTSFSYSFLNEPNDKLDDTNASICSAHLEVTEVINYIETNTEEYTSPSDQMDAIANFDFLEQLQGQCEIQTTQKTGEDYDTALTKLTEYFAPKKNVEYEIYKFRQTKQETDETIDAFHTKLRQLSVNCEFTDDNQEVKSQIVQGCSSSRLRRKALREDMTLEQLLLSTRALELSEKQANEIEHKDEKLETNALHTEEMFGEIKSKIFTR